MKYLGSLNNINLIRKIIEIHNPALIYFICYMGNPDKFKLVSRINDREVDCKLLEAEGITVFERPVHIHRGICNLTSIGKNIFDELKKYGICIDLFEILNRRDENNDLVCKNLEEFVKLFNQTFSLELDPQDIIELKRKELINKYNINIAPNNNEIITKNKCKIRINYFINKELLSCKLSLKCNCSNEWDEKFENIESYLKIFKRYEVECNKCRRIRISIDPTFYNADCFIYYNENF